MLCNCKEKCLFYILHKDDGEFKTINKVYKCARIKFDRDDKKSSWILAKKQPCNFYITEEIEKRKFVCSNININVKSNYIKPEIFTIKIAKKELLHNIYLYEMCLDKGTNFRSYYGRIQYYLNILNFKPFIYTNESICDLKTRISQKADKIKNVTVTFPKKFIDMEKLVGITTNKNCYKKIHNGKVRCIRCLNFSVYRVGGDDQFCNKCGFIYCNNQPYPSGFKIKKSVKKLVIKSIKKLVIKCDEMPENNKKLDPDSETDSDDSAENFEADIEVEKDDEEEDAYISDSGDFSD